MQGLRRDCGQHVADGRTDATQSRSGTIQYARRRLHSNKARDVEFILESFIYKSFYDQGHNHRELLANGVEKPSKGTARSGAHDPCDTPISRNPRR